MLQAITGTSEEVAKKFLESANGSLELAVTNFYNSDEGAAAPAPVANEPPPRPSTPARRPAPPPPGSGVISPASKSSELPSVKTKNDVPATATSDGALPKVTSDDDDWTMMEHSPAEPQDQERDLKSLFAKYRSQIDQVRGQTKDLCTDPEHDDLFFLRYVLSFGVKDAVDAIRWAVTWRREPKNAFYMAIAKDQENGLKHKNEEGLNISAYHKGLKDGGPLQIVRPGLVDFGPMLDMHAHDRMVMFHVMQKEVAFRMCDEQSRKTGRLVKLVVINDFTAMKMSMPPKKVMQSFSESSKLAERLYPQLLQTTVCINAPTWFSMVMKVGKMFMSAKTLEKFKLCPKSGRIDQCPFVKKYLNAEDMPTFLGGPCTCSHQKGCVPGLANDAKVMRTLTKEEVAKLKKELEESERKDKEKYEKFLQTYKPPTPQAGNSNNNNNNSAPLSPK